jgi:anti-sigma regulatory factor (Ser/Thr protein kinase)
VPTRSRTLPSRPASFVEARRFVRDTAAGSASRQVLDDAMLLTSELVTNAVRHAGHAAEDPIEVTVSLDQRSLRVSVRDRGPGFDPDELDARSDEGGWGLDLVEKLSSRWGVDRGELGTDVWFEMDLIHSQRASTDVSVREAEGTSSPEGRPASPGEAPEGRRPAEASPDPSRG